MPTQEAVLSPCSGNKGKKKATSKNAKSRKRASSVKEDRCNATLELAIEEEKEKVEQPQDSEKEDEECFDLAMEDQSAEGHVEGVEMPSQSIAAPATPRNAGTMPFHDLSTPTKSRSAATFNPNVILAPTNNRSSSKRPAVESPSSFGALFLSRKSAKANPPDNELLLQMLEKIETLSKASVKQFELIQRLEEKIDNLFKADRNVGLGAGPSNQSTMASQVAAFATANRISKSPGTASSSISMSTPGPRTSKSTGEKKKPTAIHLVLDLSECAALLPTTSCQEIRQKLQSSLNAQEITSSIQLKGMNKDHTKEHRFLLFFQSIEEARIARIHDGWITTSYAKARLHTGTTYPIKVHRVKT